MSDWTSDLSAPPMGHNNSPGSIDEAAPEVHNAVAQWVNLKATISPLEKQEADLRWALAALAFPNPAVGTNTVSLGQGFEFKCKFGYNYKLNKPKLPDLFAQFGNDKEAMQLLYSCLRYKPELHEASYNALPDGPVKEALSKLVTITVAMPALELVTPQSRAAKVKT